MSYDWLYRDPPPQFLSHLGKYASADGQLFPGITKLLQFPAYADDGRPQMALIDTSSHSFGLTKIAASFPQELLDQIPLLEKSADRVWGIATALGAVEKWSSNRNADAFPRRGLKHSDPNTYGHKTFERSAHFYAHHSNKRPDKALGRVKFAFYDDDMDKVLTLFYLLKDKAPHLVDRLENGDSFAVSMGCFLAGTPVTLWDGRRVPIETLTPEDRVLTASGRSFRVRELHVREYRGKIYRLKPRAEEPIETTADHQFLIMRRADVLKVHVGKSVPRWRPDEDINLEKKQWVHASCLQKGDFLLQPADTEVETPEWATREIARLLGYYAAEGHLFYGRGEDKYPRGVQLSANVADYVHEEIEGLCKAFGTSNPPISFPHAKSEYGKVISISDPRLAKLCRDFVGCLAKGKRLSTSLMKWDPALQMEFLGAFINGDGWQNGSRWQAGSVGISTANEALAQQLVHMLLRCGIVANINYMTHKAGSGFNYRDNQECQIYISKQYSGWLSKVSKKVTDQTTGRTPSSKRKLLQGYLLIALDDVEEIPVEYVGPVYNAEVDTEDDLSHSYLVRGVAAHNCKCPSDFCSICGNEAPTRREYCSHLLEAIRDRSKQLYPDGRKVMALTPYPNFFDLSYVLRGADPIAHAWTIVDPGDEAKRAYDSRTLYYPMYSRLMEMAKTASAKESEDKDATITKRIPAMATPMKPEKEDPRVEQFAKENLPVLERSEPDLPDDLLADLAGSHKFQQILSTLASLGIVLKPQEFVQLIQGSDENPAKDPTSLQPKADCACPDIAEKVSAYWSARSCMPLALYTRSLELARPHLKTALLGGLLGGGQASGGLPPGTKVIIITNDDGNVMSQLQGAMGGHVPNMTSPSIAQGVPLLLALKMLYNQYRSNLGTSDIAQAFDKPMSPQMHALQGKRASWADEVEYWSGVPTAAYFKYAYWNPYPAEVPVLNTNMIVCDSPLLTSLLVGPVESEHKLAHVRVMAPAHLVDAVTVLTLRCAGGIQRGP